MTDWMTWLPLLVIALIQLYTAYLTNQTKKAAEQAREDVKVVLHQTNSLTEQLVTAKGEAGHAAGLAEGKRQEEARAAAKAEGIVEANKEK